MSCRPFISKCVGGCCEVFAVQNRTGTDCLTTEFGVENGNRKNVDSTKSSVRSVASTSCCCRGLTFSCCVVLVDLCMYETRYLYMISKLCYHARVFLPKSTDARVVSPPGNGWCLLGCQGGTPIDRLTCGRHGGFWLCGVGYSVRWLLCLFVHEAET